MFEFSMYISTLLETYKKTREKVYSCDINTITGKIK